MIYLAAPYNDKEPSMVNYRMIKVYDTIHDLMLSNKHVTSPLLMHEVVRRFSDMPTDYTYWESYCLDILSRCDELYVLMLPGWKESKGVTSEINYCIAREVPIVYLEI